MAYPHRDSRRGVSFLAEPVLLDKAAVLGAELGVSISQVARMALAQYLLDDEEFEQWNDEFGVPEQP